MKNKFYGPKKKFEWKITENGSAWIPFTIFIFNFFFASKLQQEKLHVRFG